jgi:hypothetical protein
MAVGLFIPKNPIETAQELQWEIDMAHPEVAPDIARQALDVLGDVRTIYESHRLIIHTLGAFILDRGGRSLEEMFEQHFGELCVQGYFGAISYVQGSAESHLQTLTVDLFDVRVLRPHVPDDPQKGKISAPLTIPVNDIQSVMVAA